jgi:hypothetical protein
MKEKILYYVYVDYTDENIPYYVGKGCHRRSVLKERNGRHDWRMRHLGLNRIIVYETYDEDSAFSTEIFLIADLHTFIHDELCTIGCNYTQGGEGPTGLVHSEETKNLIKYKRSLQTEPTHSTSILEYDLDGKFVKLWSIMNDAIRTKNTTAIPGVVNIFEKKGIVRKAGGSMWRKYDPNVEIPQQILPYKKHKQRLVTVGIIKCDLFGNEIQRYESIQQAVNEHNNEFTRAYITACCNGYVDVRETAKYKWKYIDQNRVDINKDIEQVKHIPGKPRKIARFDRETGELIKSYDSLYDAYRDTGVSQISNRCRGLAKMGEFIWKFI